MKRIFVLGDSPEWNEMLKDEHKSYKDILQINFVDAYRNMTYKHLSGYWWVLYWICSATKEEQCGVTVDWPSKIQTTNLYVPFCQLDTHTQFSFYVVNIFPFIATSRRNKIKFQSGQCYSYIVREVWFYQIWIQLFRFHCVRPNVGIYCFF